MSLFFGRISASFVHCFYLIAFAVAAESEARLPTTVTKGDGD
jgi:hypothetical protein